MKSFTIIMFAFILSLIGCDSLTAPHHETVKTETLSTGAVCTTCTTEAVTETEVSASPGDASQSTKNAVEHQVDDWSVFASTLWKPQLPPVDSVKLFLVNREENLIVSYLKEKSFVLPIEYVNHQMDFLRSLKLPEPTLKTTTINGVGYYLIESPGSNFSNWQWVLVEDGYAYVWSCGGPRNHNPSLESCLTVMTTLEKHR